MSLATHLLQLGDQRVDHLEDALVHRLGGEDDAGPSTASFRGSLPPALRASFRDQRQVEPRSPGFEKAQEILFSGGYPPRSDRSI